MKPITLLLCGIAIALLPFTLTAQKALSVDIAAVSNRHSNINGLNLSVFYHFNEHWEAGAEMNRFFAVNKTVEGEALQLSAWDFDYNVHYLIALNNTWQLYPLTGFSHTAEQEFNTKLKETNTTRFWSINTGAGIMGKLGKWSPHIEYSFTWGYTNQQFIIAGFSYELALHGKHR